MVSLDPFVFLLLRLLPLVSFTPWLNPSIKFSMAWTTTLRAKNMNKCHSIVRREEENQIQWGEKIIPDTSTWCLMDISELTCPDQAPDYLPQCALPQLPIPVNAIYTLPIAQLTTGSVNLLARPSKYHIWNPTFTEHLCCHDPGQHQLVPTLCKNHLPDLPLLVLASSSIFWVFSVQLNSFALKRKKKKKRPKNPLAPHLI